MNKHCYVVMSTKMDHCVMINSVCMYCQSQDPPILKNEGNGEWVQENCYTKKEIIDYILTTDKVECNPEKWNVIFSKEEFSKMLNEDPETVVIDLNIEGINKQLKLANM